MKIALKIGIDSRILLRKENGIKRYFQSLLKALMKVDQENTYVLYLDGNCNDVEIAPFTMLAKINLRF